jgi:hypothetical protein
VGSNPTLAAVDMKPITPSADLSEASSPASVGNLR